MRHIPGTTKALVVKVNPINDYCSKRCEENSTSFRSNSKTTLRSYLFVILGLQIHFPSTISINPKGHNHAFLLERLAQV
jgi:hypothetical protein